MPISPSCPSSRLLPRSNFRPPAVLTHCRDGHPDQPVLQQGRTPASCWDAGTTRQRRANLPIGSAATMGTILPSIYDFEAREASGSLRSLADYRGKVVLIVNTASKCGFTPQYERLEQMYRNLQERGFEILAFPCNQFNKQEPGMRRRYAASARSPMTSRFPSSPRST